EIPFAISAATDGNNGGGLAGVLSQLQGARVVVSTANRTVAGSILTVEAKHSQIDATKPPVTTHRLVIASDSGEVSEFDLTEFRSLQLADEGTRRDLSEFAHAAAAARRRDAKTIVVTSDGIGDREMVVSYTIAAPIWKTTYRVVLDEKGKPFFQGWAIVDNISEEDWNGIQLSLVSGTPVSFIQQIQNPVYRYRPVVPLQQDLNMRPQTYEPGEAGASATGSLSGIVRDPAGGTVPGADVVLKNTITNQSFELTTDDNGAYSAASLPAGTYNVEVSASGFKKSEIVDLAIRPGLRSSLNVSIDVGGVSETVTVTPSNESVDGGNATLGSTITTRQISNLPLNGRGMQNFLLLSPGITSRRESSSMSNLVAGGDSGVEAQTSGSEVGDLFEYRIEQPVTVPRDRSALIPIPQTRMEGERVSIYNEGNRRDRAMGGMLLKNTSSLTLEGGAMTVIDGDAYAGEALMERLKPGEERLISFALDLGTLVNPSIKADRAPAFMVRAINGVFQAHYYETNKKVYTLTNQTDKPRVVFIEHALRQDWTLTDDTARPDAKTARYYRFRVPLGPHQKVELPVTEHRALMDSYALMDFSRPDLELFIARNYIDAATRTTLEKIL